MAALGRHVGDSVRERGAPGSARAQLLLAERGRKRDSNGNRVWQYTASGVLPSAARAQRRRAHLRVPPSAMATASYSCRIPARSGRRFLPLSAGNVRRDDVMTVYRTSQLFRRLRRPEDFGGGCGSCRYRYACGGSRARRRSPLAARAVRGRYVRRPVQPYRPKR